MLPGDANDGRLQVANLQPPGVNAKNYIVKVFVKLKLVILIGTNKLS